MTNHVSIPEQLRMADLDLLWWSFSNQLCAIRCFNVYTKSITLGRRGMNVKMTLCTYWGVFRSLWVFEWMYTVMVITISVLTIFFQIIGGPIAHPVYVAIQTRPNLHPGWGGCRSRFITHPKHWTNVTSAFSALTVHCGVAERRNVQ